MGHPGRSCAAYMSVLQRDIVWYACATVKRQVDDSLKAEITIEPAHESHDDSG